MLKIDSPSHAVCNRSKEGGVEHASEGANATTEGHGEEGPEGSAREHGAP